MPGMSKSKTVVIVGGGFSGALCGLKLHARHPDWRIVIAEPRKRLGRGVAYGSCDPGHLLNVPVSRMEVGLTPSFTDWLRERTDLTPDALVESGLDLSAAYVPRRLFGDYVEERVNAALDNRSSTGLSGVRGEVVRLLTDQCGVVLSDGRQIGADIVVLAMGNLPPRPPPGPDPWLYDSGYFISDPWAANALADLTAEEPVLLLGTGLTTVDMVLRLQQMGHRGPVMALSRRGLTPRAHAAGGTWPAFLAADLPASARALTRLVREQVELAAARGIPWQRVFDAARPALPDIWRALDFFNRRQFLRHLRARWDVHRHRMAPRVQAAFEQLCASGAVEIVAGRITGYRPIGRRVEATIHLRGGGKRVFEAGHVVNCTGPDGSFQRVAIPLIAQLRERRLAEPDPLGIGLKTRDCSVIDGAGEPSSWLYALGPLTRPAWWEITAVPEINQQIDRLVAQLSGPASAAARPGSAGFEDVGRGI